MRHAYSYSAQRSLLSQYDRLSGSSPEQAPNNSSRNIPRQPRPVYRIRRKATRLAEFITSRERKRIRNRKDQRDNFLFVSPFSICIMHNNLPTSVSQMNSRLTSANIASRIHSTGCAYSAIQKNRLSVALTSRVSGSALSKTHRPSPVCESTSFHHLRPTRRRPAMFLR